MPTSNESLKICMTRPSAFLLNDSTRFSTILGVFQGCLLPKTLFKIFLERITCEAFEDHEGSVSIGGQLVTNVLFADYIVINAKEEKPGFLVDRLDTTTIKNK